MGQANAELDIFEIHTHTDSNEAALWPPAPANSLAQTARLIALRKFVYRRANYSCEECGKTGVPLDMHHLTYACVGEEFPSDVIVLCRDCHDRRHWARYGFEREPEEAAWQQEHFDYLMAKDD